MLERIHEIPLQKVQVTDPFWKQRRELVAETAVPYMEKILTDAIDGAEKSHAIENFRIAAGDAEGAFYGMVFQDSDVYKWLETAAYSLSVKRNPALEKRMDEIIDIIARAQQPDGYLNTYFTLVEPDKKWTNFLECHELYCAGHMLEAAVAHHQMTGKRNLLDVGIRLADHIVDRFLNSDAVPGHQEIEIGLLRLYRVTGDIRYRDMATAFLNRRGQDPDYFRKHTPAHPGIHYGGYDIDPGDTDYNQSFAPIREQNEARGHAVRCMYMLTAMADAAEANDDSSLCEACERMWKNITRRQMYVTGGLGATAHRESFLADWQLPNDTAYNETCASVAMVFFAQRMLNLIPNSEYADIMELELYNGALSGMQLDGTRYFYVNPLEVDPSAAGKLPGYEHVLPERQKWLSCACCPPNLSRLICSLGKYIWSESEKSVYAHLFIGSRAETAFGNIDLDTGWPWNGTARYTVRSDRAFALMIRIPAFIKQYELRVNGSAYNASSGRGYLKIERQWQNGDVVTLSFDLLPRRIHADPRVRADAGKTALARGPFIYCFEGIDNGECLSALRLPPDSQIVTKAYEADLLNGIASLSAAGKRTLEPAEQYTESAPEETDVFLTAIPYYAWANRGVHSMCVWIRE